MKSQYLIFVFILGVSVAGCATLGMQPHETPEEKLFDEYFQKGRASEYKGDLVAAFNQYKLALTVNSSNQEVLDHANRVKSSLRRLAEGHYKAGLKLNEEGKYGRGRQQFLIALRLWPDFPEVIERLTTRDRIQIKRYVVHTVKSGESVSRLAKIYYGDSQKFPIIAKYNNFTDATRIEVGQKIKIPEIEGMEFLAGKESIETEGLEPVELSLIEWDWEEYALEEREEPVDQVAIYRNHGIDLFRKKHYHLALVEFRKVLNAQPDDRFAVLYSHKSHYQLAMDFFNKRDYLAARDQFQAARRYRSDCQECDLYIERSEDLYKDLHYKKGIKFFDRELLSKAIREWELVRLIDPNYKKVNELIDKAKTLQKKIEELKQTQKS